MNLPEKLKKQFKEDLSALMELSFDKSLFVDMDVLNKICKISESTGYEISLLIDRKGHIIDVACGDKSSCAHSMDDVEGYGYSGIRLIHTHPNASSNLSGMDLSFLRNKKLDLICAVSIKNGEAYGAQVAYLTGEKPTIVNVHDCRYINKYGLMEKIPECEKEYVEYQKKLNALPKQKAILVKVALKNKENIERDLNELESLAKTAGIETIDKISQFRVSPDAKYFIGKGKIDLIKEMIQLYEANIVIFDNELTGSKLSNISNALNVKVIDRSMLILDIFAGRARTNEGKLQVELAQLKYSLPRLSSYLESSGRFGGGVGMRGPGETKLELNRRVVEQNIQRKSEELKKLKNLRNLNRQSRLKNSKPTVSIVGYTNSGKSTLTNLLAKADVYVKDELFATLDTTTRNVWLGDKKEILVTDTVGFINNLPHEFIDAFASTLEECIYADLILHVVDISDPDYQSHINVTNQVLNNLGNKSPVLMVYNKCDKVSDLQKDPNAIYISARTGFGVEQLKQVLIEKLFKN